MNQNQTDNHVMSKKYLKKEYQAPKVSVSEVEMAYSLCQTSNMSHIKLPNSVNDIDAESFMFDDTFTW